MVRIVYGDTLSCHFYYHVMHTYYLICILFCLYPPGEDGTNSGLKISVDDADMNTKKPPAVTPTAEEDERRAVDQGRAAKMMDSDSRVSKRAKVEEQRVLVVLIFSIV